MRQALHRYRIRPGGNESVSQILRYKAAASPVIVVRCGVVWYGGLHCGAKKCCMVWCNVLLCNVVWYGVVWFGMVLWYCML